MISFDFIIPVYNEESRIHRTFAELKKFKTPKNITLNKIIFVNDGSTDKTLELIKTNSLPFPKKIISYSNNMGKGRAIKIGLSAVTADYCLFFDADISTPLTELKKLLPFVEKNLPIIIGTRKNGHSTVTVHQSFIRENMGKIFTILSKIILNTWVTDFTCGFKVLVRPVAHQISRHMTINGWSYDSEILYLAKKFGYPIQEKSVIWANQKNTKVNLFTDSFSSLYELFLIRFRHSKKLTSPRLFHISFTKLINIFF